MRLGKDVMLEIVAIVQEGLSTGTDISQRIRDIDVSIEGSSQDEVVLSPSYRSRGKRVEA